MLYKWSNYVSRYLISYLLSHLSYNYIFCCYVIIINRRIAFCLDVHNEAVKSMRYPPDDLYSGKGDNDSDSDSDDDDDEDDDNDIYIDQMVISM